MSAALVQLVAVGDVLRLGSPIGSGLTLSTADNSDLLLLAGGIGLAPLRALADQVAGLGGQRRVALFVGARTSCELYDLKSLGELRERYPGLTIGPVLSDDPLHRGEQATVVDAALRWSWPGYHVYACGSQDMVRGTVQRLISAGVSHECIHVEELANNRYVKLPADEEA